MWTATQYAVFIHAASFFDANELEIYYTAKSALQLVVFKCTKPQIYRAW